MRCRIFKPDKEPTRRVPWRLPIEPFYEFRANPRYICGAPLKLRCFGQTNNRHRDLPGLRRGGSSHALRIRRSSTRFSLTWMRKRRNPKPRCGRPAGRRRSEGCSTRRGDNPRMTAFGLRCQRRSKGGGWPGGRRTKKNAPANGLPGWIRPRHAGLMPFDGQRGGRALVATAAIRRFSWRKRPLIRPILSPHHGLVQEKKATWSRSDGGRGSLRANISRLLLGFVQFPSLSCIAFVWLLVGGTITDSPLSRQ